MFVYAVIDSGGLFTDVVEQDKPISYDKMVECVGGFIEAVYLNGAVGYVNEEGKIFGLPNNVHATKLAHNHEAIYNDDYIAGNMLIVGNCDDEGEMMTLTTEWINANL